MIQQEHLKWQKKFPSLNDWLNLNGYSIIYTGTNEKLKQIYSFWSDRSSEKIEGDLTHARNWIMIIYCEECNAIELYKRVTLGGPDHEKAVIEELDRQFFYNFVKPTNQNHKHENDFE